MNFILSCGSMRKDSKGLAIRHLGIFVLNYHALNLELI